MCEKCGLHSALHGETVCSICFWKYGKYPYYKKAMEAVASHYCGVTGFYNRTSKFSKKIVKKIGHYGTTKSIFINEGWSILPKICAVGCFIASMKNTHLNYKPKTTAKITDYFSTYWLDKFEFSY